MNSAMNTYLEATQKCVEQCEIMVEYEQEKRQSLLDDDVKRLEVAMQNQQAAIMTMEALEKKRLSVQAKAGFAGDATAAEILSALGDGPEKAALEPMVVRLRRSAEGLKDLNKTAMDIAKTNVQIFSHQTAASQSGKSPTYKPGQPQSSGWSGGTAFEQKI